MQMLEPTNSNHGTTRLKPADGVNNSNKPPAHPPNRVRMSIAIIEMVGNGCVYSLNFHALAKLPGNNATVLEALA